MATLRTNSKEFMNRFAAYFMETVEARIDDHNEYVEHKDYDINSLTDCLKAFWSFFDDEFNNPHNKKMWPNLQERTGQWLRGLPIGIDYTTDGIIRVANLLRSIDEYTTQKKLDSIVDNWFEFFAHKVIQLSEENHVRIPR